MLGGQGRGRGRKALLSQRKQQKMRAGPGPCQEGTRGETGLAKTTPAHLSDGPL